MDLIVKPINQCISKFAQQSGNPFVGVPGTPNLPPAAPAPAPAAPAPAAVATPAAGGGAAQMLRDAIKSFGNILNNQLIRPYNKAIQEALAALKYLSSVNPQSISPQITQQVYSVVNMLNQMSATTQKDSALASQLVQGIQQLMMSIKRSFGTMERSPEYTKALQDIQRQYAQRQPQAPQLQAPRTQNPGLWQRMQQGLQNWIQPGTARAKTDSSIKISAQMGSVNSIIEK